MSKGNKILKPNPKLSSAKQALLEQRLRGVSQQQPVKQFIRPRPDPEIAPLSFAQERFWFFDQYQPGTPAYNRPMALQFTGTLDIAVLKQTLNELLRRHEVLRASFVGQNGRPIQVIAPARSLPLPVVDLSAYPAAECETRTLQSITKESLRPFDLRQSPLIRATLFRLSQTNHILLLVIHHIAFDGWSAHILKRELLELYEAYVAGLPVSLAPLPIQYADFADWQRQQLQNEKLDALLAYWLEKLAGAPASLNLPTDYPRPAAVTHNGAHYQFLLPASLLNQLKALSRREDATLFMTLLAAFFILLHRYSGQDDIVLGSPIAGRSAPETEKLLGYFVNTLALRADLAGNPTFRTFLSQIKETTLDAYEHQDLPFEKLIEALKPQRDLSRAPLFQVLINLENIPHQPLQSQGLNITDFEFDSQITQFDLTLEMIKQETGLMCSLGYNTDLFARQTIERLAGHFQTLLAGIVANPAEPIGYLPLLTGSEQQLLAEWNNTQTDYPKDLCIHQLFESQVEQTPDNIAVVFEDEALTYRELNQRANQLAHYLQKLGVGPEVLVGICIERSIEMVVGILGVLKAGGAYVPLAPSYPQERLAFILKDTQAPILLTQQKLLKNIPPNETHAICLDTEWPTISKEMNTNPNFKIASRNLVYIIYTSGSSGNPKGVMVQHSSLVNYIQTIKAKFGLKSEDRVLQFTSISWDASAEEIYSSLTCGATLALCPRYLLDSIPTFLQKCQSWSISVIILPTAYWHELAAQISSNNLLFPASIRLTVIGGERALPSRLHLWQKHISPQVQMINAYGPTEATISATIYNLPGPQKAAQGDLEEMPIGKPINNIQVYLLDRYLNSAPLGVPGELYIGGDGLARGYLNSPSLTAEKFIPNPFSNEPGTRLYKTGDLARYLPDGNIEFLGRMDDQVKIRGFRIEPGEIETALRKYAYIQDVTVINHEDETGHKRLVAYVTPKAKDFPTVSELRHFLQQKLPDYMIPSAFVFLEALPLNPNGKVDRRALPAPDSTRPNLNQDFTPPENDVEKVLAGIWEEVLDLKQVGLFDNFFELGGHSLLATQIISRINALFEIDTPLRTLFEAPTITELAKALLEPADSRQHIEQTAQLILELSELSDEEINVMLKGELSATKNKEN